ncbi:MAG: transcriptional regulator [Gammaproteobacteria bacterium]|nr:transcriptional regulator [Gammaproteobacteria bacterium]|tara:strand:+ start:526 stop:792 length:267 start_codon:yes stop_codon:yes gene_type:complete
MGVTSIRLQDDLDKSLADIARKTSRSKNWIINQAIKDYVENQAIEERRWLDTLPALESVESGNSVPAEEVEAWLKSWGRSGEKQFPDR